MIETWFAVFLIIHIRNKIIDFLEKNNVYLYQKYEIKRIFNHPSIVLPLLSVFFYIFLEYTIFIKWYYFVPYHYIIKDAMLLSYFPLIFTYKLWYSDNPKYINNWQLSLITSPVVKSGIFLLLGSISNKIALHFNNGYMPTYPSLSFWTKYIDDSGFIDGVHILGNAHSAVVPLCNIFDCFGYGVLSLGDLLIRMNVFILLYYSIKKSNKISNKI